MISRILPSRIPYKAPVKEFRGCRVEGSRSEVVGLLPKMPESAKRENCKSVPASM